MDSGQTIPCWTCRWVITFSGTGTWIMFRHGLIRRTISYRRCLDFGIVVVSVDLVPRRRNQDASLWSFFGSSIPEVKLAYDVGLFGDRSACVPVVLVRTQFAEPSTPTNRSSAVGVVRTSLNWLASHWNGR